MSENTPPISSNDEQAMSITKPSAFSLDKFKSKRAAALANVETLLTALPHHSLSQAKDFVRLHPDEANYWTGELCFVSVPIKGQKRDTQHLEARHFRPRAISYEQHVWPDVERRRRAKLAAP